MSTQRVITGAVYVADPRSGRPIANGSVYIGLVNQDPKILANRITVNVIQQDGSTVPIPPASQPLTTDAGGLIQYNGSPVQVTCTGAYSIAVYDQYGAGPLPYFPSVSNPLDFTTAFLQPDQFYTNDGSSSSGAYVLVPPASITPTPSSLVDGMEVTFRPSNANGATPSTISIILSGGPSTPYPALLPDAVNDLPDGYLTTYTDVKFRLDLTNHRWVNQDMGLFATNPSVQKWSAFVNYSVVPSYVTGSDDLLYKSIATSGPALGGAVDPVGGVSKWVKIFESTAGNAGHIYGLITSRPSTTTTGTTAGSARDSTNAVDMSASSAWTKKINAVWAAGTGNGGFPSGLTAGSPVNDTWYSYWMISKPDGTVDFGYDSKANGIANNPALLLADAVGYTYWRRISWVRYGTAALVNVDQYGNNFYLNVMQNDLSSGSNTAGTSVTTSAPPSGSDPIIALTQQTLNNDGTVGSYYAVVTALSQTNSVPSSTLYDTYSLISANYDWSGAMAKPVLTDGSSAIRYRVSAANAQLDLFTIGWIDTRGQY